MGLTRTSCQCVCMLLVCTFLCAGTFPETRMLAAAATAADVLYIYGGLALRPRPNTDPITYRKQGLSDAWSFNLTSKQWKELKISVRIPALSGIATLVHLPCV